MISSKIADDFGHMRTAVCEGRLIPIVESQKFAFPGAQGVSPDASTSLQTTWGVHAFDRIKGAQWTASTRKLIENAAISINSLELLAAASAIVLIGQTRVITKTRQVALQCDNTTADKGANSGA